MKYLTMLLSAAVIMAGLTACGSQKKAAKTPIKTFVQPCSEYMSPSAETVRAWGIGKSDSEATARKKAQTLASAELAAQLQKTVQSTVEDYSTVLTESGQAASKALLIAKTKIAVDQTLRGATTICDKWNKDEQTGQYTNYVVMEVNPDLYIKAVKDALVDTGTTVNEDLLRETFLKNIGK